MDSGPPTHREADTWVSQCMSGVVAFNLLMCREAEQAHNQCLFLGGSDSRGSDLAAYAK